QAELRASSAQPSARPAWQPHTQRASGWQGHVLHGGPGSESPTSSISGWEGTAPLLHAVLIWKDKWGGESEGTASGQGKSPLSDTLTSASPGAEWPSLRLRAPRPRPPHASSILHPTICSPQPCPVSPGQAHDAPPCSPDAEPAAAGAARPGEPGPRGPCPRPGPPASGHRRGAGGLQEQVALAGEPETPRPVLDALLWGLPHPPPVGADHGTLAWDRESPGAWWGGRGPDVCPGSRVLLEAAQGPEWEPPLARDVKDLADLRVQLREQHLYYQDQLLPVSRIIVHPQFYAVQIGADIALLELEEPVNVSSHVHTVTLPPALETFPPGTLCWVTGWGDVDNDVRLPPPYPLKEVEVPIVENQLCDAEYHTGLHTGDSFRIVRDDMLCAGGSTTPARATPEGPWSAR
uniref:Peptidase S1 domain-containing protein n=1 Tax=Macaca fascicularis TaxID=9541 RepID=A0A2K5VIU6_MACFA